MNPPHHLQRNLSECTSDNITPLYKITPVVVTPNTKSLACHTNSLSISTPWGLPPISHLSPSGTSRCNHTQMVLQTNPGSHSLWPPGFTRVPWHPQTLSRFSSGITNAPQLAPCLASWLYTCAHAHPIQPTLTRFTLASEFPGRLVPRNDLK